MDASKFVESLKTECRDAAVKGCVETLISPPGRKPAHSLVEISNWFVALSTKEQEMVIRAMSEAAGATLFGVLAVLDGVRPIEGVGEKSEFHLTAIRQGIETKICPSEYFLHDL